MMELPSPTMDAGENDTCTHCGSELAADQWHPATMVDDGSRIVTFCDQRCRDAWHDTRRDG